MAPIDKLNQVNNQNVRNYNSSINQTPQQININIGKEDPVIKKLCEQFGITPEEYREVCNLHPDFNSISDISKQQAIINDLKNSQINNTNNDSEIILNHEKLVEAYQQEETADKLKYNQLTTVNDKMTAVISAAAKNIYINGLTKQNGEVLATPHSQEEWDNLSEQEKENYINKFSSNIKNYAESNEDIKYLNTLMKTKTDEKTQITILDSVMRDIEVATFNEMSIADFMRQDEYQKLDLTEEYMSEFPDALNETDLEYRNRWINITKAVCASDDSIPKDLCPSEARKYIKYNNLNEDELLYQTLSQKAEKGILTDAEKKQYESLDGLFSNEAGRSLIEKAKAANLQKLEEEYRNFDKINGDQELYKQLEKTINSKESEKLRNIPLPKVKNDFEAKVKADVEAFDKTSASNNDNKLNAAKIAAHIELQCKDMTPAERKNYIKAYLKFSNGSEGLELYKIYQKEFGDLHKRTELLDKSSLTIADMSIQEVNEFGETCVIASNDPDEYIKNVAICAANTNSQILSKCKDAKYDEHKLINAKYNSKINNTEVLNNTTRANATISDTETAIESQKYITNSEYATDEVHINTVESAKDFVPRAQAAVMNGATEKSAKATAYVAENNIIETLDKDAQVEAFHGTHNSINKWFEGKDAIKYSNALANQIQNCDERNQLAMHEEIMTSKYTEVQENAAANIKNYSPSVQEKAMESVYKSGNEKAINRLIQDVADEKNFPALRSEALQMASDWAMTSAKSSEELHKKFLNGNLTLQEVKQLSSSDRKKYIDKYFSKLGSNEKIKFLKEHITTSAQKKVVYTTIARTDSSLFNEMCKDKDMAEMLLGLALPQDVNKQIEDIVSFIAISDVNFQELCKLNNIKFDGMNEPLAENNKKYSTDPFAKDQYEMYPKDRYGNLIG